MKNKTIKLFDIPFTIEYYDGPVPAEPEDEDLKQGQQVYGRYYALQQRIVLSNMLSDGRKELVLFHELVHAADDILCFKDKGVPLTEAETDRIALAFKQILGGLK